jgi:hypothetical protein
MASRWGETKQREPELGAKQASHSKLVRVDHLVENAGWLSPTRNIANASY